MFTKKSNQIKNKLNTLVKLSFEFNKTGVSTYILELRYDSNISFKLFPNIDLIVNKLSSFFNKSLVATKKSIKDLTLLNSGIVSNMTEKSFINFWKLFNIKKYIK